MTWLKQYPLNNERTEYVIPDTVVGLSISSFRWSKNLTKVTLPSGITSIEGAVFSDCPNLTTITYQGVDYTDSASLKAALDTNGVSYAASFWNK